ncbi:uncharacterized protein LOC113340574 [Papaver somniferum]|uniref:uncharacterized protein LOC113340574 n=1 Tax=Papaver somniferum TaxID=3469 RepID=UPI000E6FF31F|nr:uncharacterized protein LOC113340574 [Papaver somniferum]
MKLPWDILLDILIRLPLKSIVRFRFNFNVHFQSGAEFQRNEIRFLKSGIQLFKRYFGFNLLFSVQCCYKGFSKDTCNFQQLLDPSLPKACFWTSKPCLYLWNDLLLCKH